MPNPRLRVAGPFRQSKFLGEFGYGDYWEAVADDGVGDGGTWVVAAVRIPRGADLTRDERRALTARGRRLLANP